MAAVVVATTATVAAVVVVRAAALARIAAMVIPVFISAAVVVADVVDNRYLNAAAARRGPDVTQNLAGARVQHDLAQAAIAVGSDAHTAKPGGVLRAHYRPAPYAISAVLLALGEATGRRIRCGFAWPAGLPRALAAVLGYGATAAEVRALLRRAEPDRGRRPIVHLGD